MAVTNVDTQIIPGNRIVWIDLVKLFAIFLVVLGHCYQQFDVNYKESMPFLTLSAFHMPLFMMLSGYFIDYYNITDYKTIISKRFFQLILPSLFWITIIWGTKELIGDNHISFSRNLWFGLWFLKSLFACIILLILPRCFIKITWIALIISLILSQSVIFIPHLWFLQLNVMFPSLVVGLFIKQVLNKSYKHTAIITYISFIIFISALPSFDKNILYPNMFKILTPHWIEQYPILLYRTLVGITGAIAIVGIFKLYFGKINVECRIYNRISTYGRYTMEIYILQSLILEVLISHYIDIPPEKYNSLTHVIYTGLSIIIISCCLYVSTGVKQIGLGWTFNFNTLKQRCLKYL